MQQIANVLPSVLRQLQEPEKKARQTLVQNWESIVGSKIALHTRPSLTKRGDLFVWVDQSTLAYELNQKYRQSILKRTQATLGEDAVKSVRFRVGELR